MVTQTRLRTHVRYSKWSPSSKKHYRDIGNWKIYVYLWAFRKEGKRALRLLGDVEDHRNDDEDDDDDDGDDEDVAVNDVIVSSIFFSQSSKTAPKKKFT